MHHRSFFALWAAGLLLACGPNAYVAPSAGVQVAFTAGGPYVRPYAGVGVGVSPRPLAGRRGAAEEPSEGAAEGQPIHVTTESGIEVRVDAGRVSVAGADLARCGEDDAAVLRKKLAATPVDEARWVDLLALQQRQVREITRPPGEYCAIAIRLAPEEGRSLEMEGAFRAPGEESWKPFRLVSDETVTTSRALHRPLRLAAGSDAVPVHVLFDPARWFDGIDMQTPPEEIAAIVLANLAERPGDVLTPADAGAEKEQAAAH
jgi:hypothetical protein